jgi:glutamyl-Q tRNA(Asp) synthetase
MERYRGRFAPSPTGPLHFGSLVAAVCSYLEARRNDGEWLVRIEDIDVPRVAPGAVDEMLRALEACGLHWDGEIVRQSTRYDAYHAALHELRSRGRVYACACSRREIADSALSGIEGYVYSGTCRTGLPAGRIARALRVDTRSATVTFDDLLQGRLTQNLETEIGDFIVYRADRVFAYQLAVVVDDAEQGITDVVRGADLLDSTPRQIYLQRLLGLPQPRYVHLPVAVDAGGEKLSKQTLAPAVDPDQPVPALLAALRFLGQNPPPRLEAGRVEDVWQWTSAGWRLDRVPHARQRPAALADVRHSLRQ